MNNTPEIEIAYDGQFFKVIGPNGQIGLNYRSRVAAERYAQAVERDGLGTSGQPNQKGRPVRGWSASNSA